MVNIVNSNNIEAQLEELSPTAWKNVKTHAWAVNQCMSSIELWNEDVINRILRCDKVGEAFGRAVGFPSECRNQLLKLKPADVRCVIEGLCQIGISYFEIEVGQFFYSVVNSKGAKVENKKEVGIVLEDDAVTKEMYSLVTSFTYEFLKITQQASAAAGDEFASALTGLELKGVRRVSALSVKELERCSRLMVQGFKLRVKGKVLDNYIKQVKKGRTDPSRILFRIGVDRGPEGSEAINRNIRNESNVVGPVVEGTYRAMRITRIGGERHPVKAFSGLDEKWYNNFYDSLGDKSRHPGRKVEGRGIIKNKMTQGIFGVFLSYYRLISGSMLSDIKLNVDSAILAYEMVCTVLSDKYRPAMTDLCIGRAWVGVNEMKTGLIDVSICGNCDAVVFERSEASNCKWCASDVKKAVIIEGNFVISKVS